jgi:hypothetical protein
MAGVRMFHPITGAEMTVQPEGRAIWENSGWRVAPGQDDIGPDLPAEVQQFGGEERTYMRHPNVAGDPTPVARSALATHRSVGWQEVVYQDGEWVAVEEQRQEREAKTVEELRDEARERGLKVSGTKDELLERLQAGTSDDAGDQPADDESEE